MQCTSVEASAFIVSLLTYSGFSFNSSVPVASDRPPLFESLYEYRRVGRTCVYPGLIQQTVVHQTLASVKLETYGHLLSDSTLLLFLHHYLFWCCVHVSPVLCAPSNQQWLIHPTCNFCTTRSVVRLRYRLNKYADLNVVFFCKKT